MSEPNVAKIISNTPSLSISPITGGVSIPFLDISFLNNSLPVDDITNTSPSTVTSIISG